MKLLAIETATECCSAALLVDGEIIEKSEVAPRKHNELILSMCEQVLAQGEVTLEQLDAVAFGRGPGAFTGVRLAASVAQGISVAQELPVVPVSTLAALAQSRINDAQQVLACIDARMQEIYFGVYENNEGSIMTLVGTEKVIKPSLLELQLDEDCIGLGTGWCYAEVLQEKLGLALQYDDSVLPQASAVAQLAKVYFEKGQSVQAHQALPVYLRDNVAQKKQTENQTKRP